MFETPPYPVWVCADVEGLGSVVTNLVSNALKFTEDGGWVRCRLHVVDDQAWLEVSDNGLGIPEAEQQALFTRFFRSSTALENAIQGSGLGLTIVASIATVHGGTATVRPRDDGGLSITVTIPSAGCDLPQPATPERIKPV